MNIDLRPFLALWAVLAAVVIVLIVYRKSISRHEDDSLHLSQAGVAPRQISFAHKLEHVDKWGKILTIITVIFGVILAALYVYEGWVRMSSIGV